MRAQAKMSEQGRHARGTLVTTVYVYHHVAHAGRVLHVQLYAQVNVVALGLIDIKGT